MSTPPPSSGAPASTGAPKPPVAAASEPTTPPGTVPGIPEVPGPPLSRNLPFLTAVGIILTVLVVLGALYVVGLPPFPSRTSSPPPAPGGADAYSAAMTVANSTAGQNGAGPWSVVFATGFQEPATQSLGSNLTPLLDSTLGVPCDSTTVGNAASISLAGSTANRSDGDFPDWIVLLANGSGIGYLVLVVEGVGQSVGLVTGCATSLAYFAGVPASVVDSPAAVASAMSYYGFTFQHAHPGGILSASIVSGATALYPDVPGFWQVNYTTCLGSPSAGLAGYAFSARISVSTGLVYSVPQNGSVTCPSSGNLVVGERAGAASPVPERAPGAEEMGRAASARPRPVV